MTRRATDSLTRGEALRLLEASPARSLTGLRNRAIIAVMWRGGLRCAEALSLRDVDFDPDSAAVRVIKPKGGPGRARTVYLTAGGGYSVAAWLDAKHAAGFTSPAMFCGISGAARDRPMDTEAGKRYVRMMVKRLGARAGLVKDVHPHMLRHTHAVDLDRAGIGVALIQRQLGHRSLATTQVYLQSLSDAERGDAIRRLGGEGNASGPRSL